MIVMLWLQCASVRLLANASVRVL